MKGIKLLAGWGKRYIFKILLTLFLTVLLQYLYSYIPLFIQYAFTKLGYGDNAILPEFVMNILNSAKDVLQIILFVAFGIVSLQCVRLVLRFVDNFNRGTLAENIAKDMRIKLYNHIQELPYSYHNNSDTGDLIQRCTSDIDTSSGFIANQFPEFINIIATIAFGAYQVGRINTTLMLVSLILVPISGISSVIYFRYINKKFQAIEESESKMMTIIQENLSSARVVKAFATEKYEVQKLEKQSRDYADKNKGFIKAMAIYWGASDCSVSLQYAFTMLIAILLTKGAIGGQAVDVSDMVGCLCLMGMLVFPIRGLGRLISDFGKTIVAVKRIDEVLSIKSEFSNDGTLTPIIEGNVEFKDVSFRFADDNKNFIDNVNFSIKKGETVAIIGKTGSGKSTVANLLTRMLDYQSGHIYIDGIEIKDISKKHLRKNVGIVLQDPFLFSKTIYDNIAISNKNVNSEAVYTAARTASIHKDIKQFEAGYSTIVGEKGTTLSGGQKQRLAIARILVDERPVLIFDDSLSAVDTETDLMIRKALKMNNQATTFIITHRISTAKESDKIIVLDEGKVADIGTHDELSKKEGLYKKLWHIQGELENEFEKLLEKEGAKNGRN